MNIPLINITNTLEVNLALTKEIRRSKLFLSTRRNIRTKRTKIIISTERKIEYIKAPLDKDLSRIFINTVVV